MQQTRAALRLMRPYSSGLAILSILVAMFARTRDLTLSLQAAVPLLFGAMCTYIVNDLDDVEKDRINHPNRPLPKGDITPTSVAVLYYSCLAVALLTTRLYVHHIETAFLYYSGFAACISYRYVVEYLPPLKPLYVAATTTVPLLILITYFPADAPHLRMVAVALFLSMLGRELCKDLPDRPGDPVSLLHRVNPKHVAWAAFIMQGLAVIILCRQVRDTLAAICLLAMFVVLALSYVYWFRWNRQTLALALMKLELLFGLYFLI
jgi:geranylgeranylglycerol-phosphate geranylgeranyltransferase